jgi:hypothetical protein
VIAVKITQILARLRDKAHAAGIDLSQPFFFPPEHARYSQFIAVPTGGRVRLSLMLRLSLPAWTRLIAKCLTTAMYREG